MSRNVHFLCLALKVIRQDNFIFVLILIKKKTKQQKPLLLKKMERYIDNQTANFNNNSKIKCSF